ncbi:MAG: lipid II flippase MurJ, partial [Actinomycetota bacterium]
MGSSETPSLGRGAAIVTFWTAISRVTGFFRVVAVAGALGTTFLANTYNSANTAPNLIFELMAAGVLTSVFVPTFVEHLIKGNGSKGWEIGDVLASSALVALGAVSLAVGLAAPWLIRLLLIGVDPSVRDDAVSVGSDMLRLFAPQIVLYGAGMIMTAALHAHRRFTMAAAAPIFNNVVVIGTY